MNAASPGSNRGPANGSANAAPRGRFISFEGIDGAGKSSHLDWYAQRLRERGREVVVTREPGGTELAEAVREWVLTRPMSMHTEALLVFAARQDHLERVIRPALDAGRWVVCDRFTDSTVAYQGGGRGMPLERIEALEQWVHPDLQPDRTYLFDLDPARAEQRRATVRAADRFEAEKLAFFERVRAAYLQRARTASARFVVIDSAQTVSDVRQKLENDLARL